MPNIIEKFVETKGGFTILISGPINKRVKRLAKHLAKKFKFSYINALHYTGQKNILFSEHDKIMDWDKLNKDINTKSKSGVIVSGYNFPKDKMTTHVNYHIHLSVSRTFYVDNRKQNSVDKKDKTKLYIDRFYQYSDIINAMSINKFIKIDSLTTRDTYEKVFDIIIEYVDSKIYNKNPSRDIRKNSRSKRK